MELVSLNILVGIILLASVLLTVFIIGVSMMFLAFSEFEPKFKLKQFVGGLLLSTTAIFINWILLNNI